MAFFTIFSVMQASLRYVIFLSLPQLPKRSSPLPRAVRG